MRVVHTNLHSDPFLEHLLQDRPQFASVFRRTGSPQRCLVDPSKYQGKLAGLLEHGAISTSCSEFFLEPRQRRYGWQHVASTLVHGHLIQSIVWLRHLLAGNLH